MTVTKGITCLLFIAALVSPATVKAQEPTTGSRFADRGRLEIGLGASVITNNAFIRQGFFSWRVAVHLHERVAVDLRWFAREFGGDLARKPLINQFDQRAETIPDEAAPSISRAVFAFTPGILVTPVHVEDQGVAALSISIFAGAGLVRTLDEEELQPQEPFDDQTLPSVTAGLSMRLKLKNTVAFSAHPQLAIYTEKVTRVESEPSKVLSPLLLTFQVSILTPNMR